MPSQRAEVALLASRALDGELDAHAAARLAATRAQSPRLETVVRIVEHAHRELAVLRGAVPVTTTLPREVVEQRFDVLRGQFTPRRPSRRRRDEVSAREALHAEDLDLAQAAMAGEEHAQREIYFGHIALVQHLLRTRRIIAQRDDVAQDIFFRIFNRLHTYRGDSSLKTWIHRVALNHINNVLTRDIPKQARELSESQLETPDGALSVIDSAVDPDQLQDTRVEHAERQAIVNAALARLPEAARTVVEMKEIDGLTCEEIAAVLCVPMGTVQSRLARGRVKLAEYLTSDPRLARTA